jgi:2-dehydro-3-deoxyphosphogluconate aldolase/(4S)-4-hydroxy-2-oxoglutarate aldolase
MEMRTDKDQVLRQIHEVGLIPVLRARSAAEALQIAAAIEAGGVSVLEVTMTVPGAVDVIGQIVKHSADRILVGAGTVMDPETARACMLAGAQFIVSPSLNLKTIEMCRLHGVAVFPGALTPTEIVTAWDAGADAVKVFPCSAVGGARYLQALRAPLPHIRLIPTGGVSLQTAAELFAAGAFALGVGGDLVDSAAMARGEPEVVTRNAERYMSIVKAARS